MRIIVNGQDKELPEDSTLQALIKDFCKNPEHVIAEINGDIIKKDRWSRRPIGEGDTVELVSFVGGG